MSMGTFGGHVSSADTSNIYICLLYDNKSDFW